MSVSSNAGDKGEGDPIPLSALQHFLYCPRQCALIHIEQTWAENRFTAEGRLLHEATQEAGHERRKGVRVVTAMPLASRRLGVSGIADLVELHDAGGGRWQPYPVEYKRGKPKAHRADEVQLCAQAICLEEMFNVEIPEGALFYGEPRRRTVVTIDAELRALTLHVASDTTILLRQNTTPRARYERKKCEGSSLKDDCQPRRFEKPRAVAAWRAALIDTE